MVELEGHSYFTQLRLTACVTLLSGSEPASVAVTVTDPLLKPPLTVAVQGVVPLQTTPPHFPLFPETVLSIMVRAP